MSIKLLRDKKTGRFAGSVGVGKTHTPEPTALVPPKVSEPKNHISSMVDKTYIALVAPDALSDDWKLRRGAAETQPIDPIVAKHLLYDGVVAVPAALAENTTINDELVSLALKHPATKVRTTLVYSGMLSPQELTSLSGDPHRHVRAAVAYMHPSPNILKTMLIDPDVEVLSAIAESSYATPDILVSLLGKGVKVERKLALNRLAPPQVLNTLAKSSDGTTRQRVAVNSSATAETLKILSTDKTVEVRYLILDHKYVPFTLIKAMAVEDPDEGVRDAAAKLLRVLFG